MGADQYDKATVRIARMVVHRATRHATYPTADSGEPEEPYRTAIEDAVAAQCAAYETAGITRDLTTGGATQEPRLTSTSNQGASLTFDSSAADRARERLLGGGLSLEAEAILDEVGLLGQLPGVLR